MSHDISLEPLREVSVASLIASDEHGNHSSACLVNTREVSDQGCHKVYLVTDSDPKPTTVPGIGVKDGRKQDN